MILVCQFAMINKIMPSSTEQEHGRNFLNKVKRLAAISLGLIDRVKEEVDQIDQYGQALPYDDKKILTTDSLERFLQTIRQQTGNFVEAVVDVHTSRTDKAINVRVLGIDSFNYSFILKAPQNDGNIVVLTQNFGERYGNSDANLSPRNDTYALKTYITAGKTLVDIKTLFPGLTMRLATSERKFGLDKNTYYDMLQMAKQYGVKPW